jgi:putative ABC transport system permease protein
VKIVAPEIWRISPPLDGRSGLARAALGMFTQRPEQRLQGFVSETIMIEGQSLPEHLQIASSVFAQGLLPPEKGGGRYLTLDDRGKPRAVISTKIAKDFPDADSKPKQVGDTLRVGGKPFEIIGIYETGSLITDVTIVMELESARELLKIGKDDVSTFYIEPEKGLDVDELAQRLEAKFNDIDAKSMAQFNLKVDDIMGKLDLFLLMAVGLAFLVGGVGIANTMLMSATERFAEFGVMRTTGWTRRSSGW